MGTENMSNHGQNVERISHTMEGIEQVTDRKEEVEQTSNSPAKGEQTTSNEKEAEQRGNATEGLEQEADDKEEGEQASRGDLEEGQTEGDVGDAEQMADDMEGIEQVTRELPSFPGLLQAEEYLSVREAALVMGVSARSVYGYIETGKLLGIRIGASIAVQADAVRNYERQVVGRPRTRTPVWRVPTPMNLQFMTSITVRLREGKEEALEKRMETLRASGQHRIIGTVARYIVRSQIKPYEVQIVLVWRRMVMPPPEVRETAIAALRDDLIDLLVWETAVYDEGRVLLSA